MRAALPNRGLPGFFKRHAAEYCPDLRFEFVDADGAGAEVMPRMIAELAYDVCDMSPSSLLIAAERGVAIRGLPVITLVRFPFDQIVVRSDRISQLADLGRATIGLRTWTNPFKPWLAGMLEHDFGVDLRGVTWVATLGDPISGVVLPANARRTEGRSLGDLLADGTVDAAIAPGPNTIASVVPLFPDPLDPARTWYGRYGAPPIAHLLGVRRAFATEHPAEIDRLLAGMRAAKVAYLEEITSANADALDAQARGDAAIRRNLGIDPVPIGLNAFRSGIERLACFMVEQGYLTSAPDPSALFVAGTMRT